MPLSGPLGQTGNFEKYSVDTVVSVMNAAGGIAGHQIKVITLDDKGDPATALANARSLMNSHVSAILNGSLGAGSELSVPYFMKQGVPTVLAESNTGFLDVSKYPSYFTPYASAAQYAAAYIAYAKAHNLDDFGTVSDGTPIADQATAALKKLAPAAGLKVSASVTYSPTAVDVTTQMRQLKAAGVKVVVANGYAQISHVFDALHQIGWSPIVMGIGSGSATTASVGNLASQTFYPCFYNFASAPGTLNPTSKAVIDGMAKLVGDTTTTASGALGWYDILLTLKTAIEKANSVDYKAVVGALDAGLTVPSVWPGLTFTYSASNHEGWPDNSLSLCKVSPLGTGGVGVVAS